MTGSVEIQSWQDIKARLIGLNPTIATEIDTIPGVNEFPVLIMRYSFGTTIVDHGQFYVPTPEGSVPIQSSSVSAQIKDLLNYHWQVMPFGMMLHNSVETHHALPSHTIPLRLYHPGRMFSLLSIFEQPQNSHILPESYFTVAGCRSLLS